jgi:hypothetical protein
MTIKSKLALSLATIALLSFTGCGSSNSSSSSSTETKTKSNVTVVDGYVTGAKVCDANNVCANTNGNGVATAAFDLTKSLSSKGGFIDLNGNGTQDNDEVSAPDMQVPAGKTTISPLTDLVVKGVKPAKLAEVLGVSESDIFADPYASNNVDLAKAIQIVYALNQAGVSSKLVEKVNSYTASTEANTDLPPMEATKTPSTKTEKNTTETKTASTDLPPMGKAATTDLPPMGDTEPVAVTKTEENTTETKTASTDLPPMGDTTKTTETKKEVEATTTATTGSLKTFVNLVTNLSDDTTVNTFIQNVLNTNVTNASDIETAIATEKKALADNFAKIKAEAPATATETKDSTEAKTAETKTEEVKKEANATTVTPPAIPSTENNTTETKPAEDKKETKPAETTTTSSANTDLPPM